MKHKAVQSFWGLAFGCTNWPTGGKNILDVTENITFTMSSNNLFLSFLHLCTVVEENNSLKDELKFADYNTTKERHDKLVSVLLVGYFHENKVNKQNKFSENKVRIKMYFLNIEYL